jgi:hypothetical protein
VTYETHDLPFVHGVVVVRRPYFYRHRHPLFVRRVYAGRSHHRDRWDDDDDE